MEARKARLSGNTKREAGFGHVLACQTILGELTDPVDTDHLEISFPTDAYKVHEGYGEGAFVVLSAEKNDVAQPLYCPHKDKRSLL
jgi:hypothetical protein